jgi:hypothetical protein
MPLGAAKIAYQGYVASAGPDTSIAIGTVDYSGTTDNYSNQSIDTTGASTGIKTPSAITIVFVAKPTYNLERLNIMGISDINNTLRNNVFINTTGTIRFYNALASGTSDRTSTETLDNNDWNVVAISKDVSTGQISGWMNGSSVTFPSETITGTTFDFDGSAADIGIGTARSGDHNSYMWNGEVAWVGVWPTYTDFTTTANQEAVWDDTNSRGIWPGADGSGYGFGAPIIFHYGDETTVATNRGNIADYTLTEGGTPSNGADYSATDGSRDRTQTQVMAYADAQVDTAQSKFGGASAYFDGTGDGLLAGEVELSSGTWTMECFIRFVNTNTNEIIFDPRFGSQPVRIPALRNGRIGYFAGSWKAGATVQSTNTWHHFAWVYDGTYMKGYVNGTLDLTYTETATFIDSKLAIGARYDLAAVYLNGHLDEIRISNNARYTSNFTAPTSAFTNDANTVLLLHCNGTDGSTVFNDDNS